MVSKNVEGEKRPVTVVRPPAASGDNTLTRMPLTWNSGRMSKQRSAAVTSSACVIMPTIAVRLAWSSITPFGLPVEPLV